MATAALLVGAISIFSLYHTAIEQHRLRLVETVKSQARLIEAIAEFDALANEDNDLERIRKSTIAKVAAAHKSLKASATAVNSRWRVATTIKLFSC